MKRTGSLYHKIFDFENVHRAYLLARKNKRYKNSILEFGERLEENLIQIQNELIWKTYKTGNYNEFFIYEPKQRLIKSLIFKDRVVQHAICNIIEPIFEMIFIKDSYACRLNKGTHKGIERLTYFLEVSQRNNNKCYALKCDIQKYFPSIDHKILFDTIKRKIKCNDTLELIWGIINSDGEKGIPIGNLTSQLFANIYLNQLDHFIKEKLRVKFYLRYMDDFIIIHNNKKELSKILQQIDCYLNNSLKLKLNSKTSIFPVWHGIDFLGYRQWKTHRLLRKSNVTEFKRRLRGFEKAYSNGKIYFDKINESIQSWIGHAKFANTFNLRVKLFNEFKLRIG